eukprot:1158371-Pelagomonas_calceolata.AAC.5
MLTSHLICAGQISSVSIGLPATARYAQVDTRNPRVLASHLVCAAAEMPLDCSGVAHPQPHPQALTVSGARDAALFGAANLWVRRLFCVIWAVRQPSESWYGGLHKQHLNLRFLNLDCCSAQ